MSSHARIEIAGFDALPLPGNRDAPECFAIETAPGIKWKRSIDIMLALALGPLVLAVTLPLLALVAMDGGSPLYRHSRVGRGGKLFRCCKIRTMTIDAETRLRQLLDSNHLAREEWSEQFKLRRDPRVTRLGRFLRRTSLDELPQLWNVLTGEMSLVGPRPVIVEELERYGEFAPAYLVCRPGISGLWQISGRNDTSYDERIAYDTRYAATWSLALDAKILLWTAPAVLGLRGSY